MMDIKDRVLETLKTSRLSSSRVAGILGIDYNYALRLLEELENESKIKREVETNATYWSLK